MDLHVGTSGYSYKEWKGPFYPEKLAPAKMLAYYAERLSSVEINNTFYRMPKEEVLEKWRDSVPERFRFVLKASRQITHRRRLNEAGEAARYLVKTSQGLGEKRGPFLLQLPPYLRKDTDRLGAFLDACGVAGFDATLSRDIERDQWEKFVFLVGLTGITGLTREPIGPSLGDPDRRALFHDLMKEVVAVGRADGVALDPDFADDRLAFAETVPAEMRASLLEDLERGNRLELDWLAGEVVRRGRALGVPTPANAAVYVGLKPFAEGGDGAS